MPNVLSVSNLRKDYGGMTAVENLSFNVQRGEIVGLLGPNGAGKTTTINMILGVLEPTSGDIRIHDLNIATHRPAARPPPASRLATHTGPRPRPAGA